MDQRPARRAPRHLVGGLVILLVVLVSGWAVQPPAEAGTSEVQVERAGFAPTTVTVRVGDTVVWTWTVDGESVTAEDGSFDSHEDCRPVRPWQCGREGETFSHTFEEPGTVSYVSRQTGAEGTVEVEAAPPSPSPPPEPEPSDDPSPSPTRSSEPTPSPTTTSPTHSPSPDPTSERPPPAPSDDANPPPADGGSPPSPDDERDPGPTTRTAAPNTLDSESATAEDSETPRLDAPSLADDEPPTVPEPTFEDFPEAPDATPAGQDVEGEVAITSADDGGTSRVVWGTVGGLTVLGTLGAFGRRVLFADPWDT